MSDPSFCFVLVQVELLAAKNLIGANLNGTSDPYAILNCGSEKRFRFFFFKKNLLFFILLGYYKFVMKSNFFLLLF